MDFMIHSVRGFSVAAGTAEKQFAALPDRANDLVYLFLAVDQLVYPKLTTELKWVLRSAYLYRTKLCHTILFHRESNFRIPSKAQRAIV